MFDHEVEGARRFLRVTGALGVLDIARSGEGGPIYVIVKSGLDQEQLQVIRELADREWAETRLAFDAGENSR